VAPAPHFLGEKKGIQGVGAPLSPVCPNLLKLAPGPNWLNLSPANHTGRGGGQQFFLAAGGWTPRTRGSLRKDVFLTGSGLEPEPADRDPASSFHKAVDDRGPAVVIGRTEGGVLFGGFNGVGWAQGPARLG